MTKHDIPAIEKTMKDLHAIAQNAWDNCKKCNRYVLGPCKEPCGLKNTFSTCQIAEMFLSKAVLDIRLKGTRK